MTRILESLVAVHTHTHASGFLINNNMIQIIKKIVIRA